MPKADDVQQNVNRMAKRYDLMNKVMTLGIDRRWRYAAVRAAKLILQPAHLMFAAERVILLL